MSAEKVNSLIDKAAAADKSDDALKFSQAATNAANAMCALKTAEGIAKGIAKGSKSA